MFSDPVTLSVNGVNKVCPRTSSNGTSSIYELPDGTLKFTVSHAPQKVAGKSRIRSMVRIDTFKVVPDPLTSVNDLEGLAVYLVIDRPVVGFSSTEIFHHTNALEAFLDATSVDKLFGKES